MGVWQVDSQSHDGDRPLEGKVAVHAFYFGGGFFLSGSLLITFSIFQQDRWEPHWEPGMSFRIAETVLFVIALMGGLAYVLAEVMVEDFWKRGCSPHYFLSALGGLVVLGMTWLEFLFPTPLVGMLLIAGVSAALGSMIPAIRFR